MPAPDKDEGSRDRLLKPGRLGHWRRRTNYLLFGDEVWTAKAVDVIVLIAILASVFVVMLESIPAMDASHRVSLQLAEWIFTAIFTAEYFLRMWCARSPVRYARSFYGIIDLMAVVPTYISLLVPGAHALIVIRLLRILRVFRVLKLVHYLPAEMMLLEALKASRRKIIVFVVVVFVLVTILGSLIYLIEGAENGYDSIPRSIYLSLIHI